MNREEALEALKHAPCSEFKSRINPALTEVQCVDILERYLTGLSEGTVLTAMMVQRVNQVCQNRKRPERREGGYAFTHNEKE